MEGQTRPVGVERVDLPLYKQGDNPFISKETICTYSCVKQKYTEVEMHKNFELFLFFNGLHLSSILHWILHFQFQFQTNIKYNRAAGTEVLKILIMII